MSPPQLINNTLSLYSGEKVLLNATYLAAIDRNHDNASLVFVPTSVTYGQFEAVNLPGKAHSQFHPIADHARRNSICSRWQLQSTLL